MTHEDFMSPEELDKMREQFKESPQRETSVKTPIGKPDTPETSDLDTIESLIATKKHTKKALAELAESLQTRLHLLNEAVAESETPDCEHCRYKATAEQPPSPLPIGKEGQPTSPLPSGEVFSDTGRGRGRR